MNENNINRKLALTAHIASDVFSPLLVPTYATAITLWYTLLHCRGGLL